MHGAVREPRPMYLEWQPDAMLARHVACTWEARPAANGEPHTDRVLPDGCIDLIFSGSALTIAGPDTCAVVLDTPSCLGDQFLLSGAGLLG